VRIFFATGEASGDMLAAALATAMREFEPAACFWGIGGERMREAGFTLTTHTTGWASLGPLAALRRIPPLLFNMLRNALWLRLRPYDLVVLIDFGAYNLRFARTLRALGYRRPILYFFPPGAWLDRARQARAVAASAVPLVPFEHQRDFFGSLGCEVAYFGHPLASLVHARSPRAPAPCDGGLVALLPGSRRGEIALLLPRLLEAAARLQERRPKARFIVSIANDEAARYAQPILAAQRYAHLVSATVRGAGAAFDVADAAWIASGTAVLEATLREVPTVALYALAPAQAAIGRRVWLGDHPYVTLPNILLGREVVPELLQDDATPQKLCDALGRLLADPAPRLDAMRAVRAALGPPDALRRGAAFAAVLARSP